jgi:hypothetical protein
MERHVRLLSRGRASVFLRANCEIDCDAITSIRVLLDEHAKGVGVRVLAGACGLSRFSCGNPKLSRPDADDPLEVKGKKLIATFAVHSCDRCFGQLPARSNGS